MSGRTDEAEGGAVLPSDNGIYGRAASTGGRETDVVRCGADDGIRIEMSAASFG